VNERLGEMLRDTENVRSHEIAVILGEQAAQARRRADRSSERDAILGPLGDLFDYQYGPALKAAETRAKNNRGEDTPPTKPSAPPAPTKGASVTQVAPAAQAAPTAQATPSTPSAPAAPAVPSAPPAPAAS
jgi:hypothetical protein